MMMSEPLTIPRFHVKILSDEMTEELHEKQR